MQHDTSFFPEDPTWLHRIADGDETAFALFFNHYYPRMLPFVQKFFPGSAQAEEALQETFIRVWLNRDQLPGIENMQAWLYTIASRQCLSALRKELAAKKKQDELARQPLTMAETPQDTVQAAEIARLVQEAIYKMPPARQRIFRMSREAGLKPAAIAEELSLSVNTVKNTLVTALKEIRDHLAAAGHIVSLIYLLFLHY